MGVGHGPSIGLACPQGLFLRAFPSSCRERTGSHGLGFSEPLLWVLLPIQRIVLLIECLGTFSPHPPYLAQCPPHFLSPFIVSGDHMTNGLWTKAMCVIAYPKHLRASMWLYHFFFFATVNEGGHMFQMGQLQDGDASANPLHDCMDHGLTHSPPPTLDM